MVLREINRRMWLAKLPAIFVTSCLLSPFSHGEMPTTAARVTSLSPLGADQPVPVVTAIAIDPSGKWLAVAGDDKVIRILQADNFEQVATLRGHQDLIKSIAFRPDGRILASGGNDGNLILWNQGKGFGELKRVDQLPAISSLQFSPNGKQIVAVGFSPDVMLFGNQVGAASMRADGSDLRSCVFDSQGERIAVAGRSGNVQLFNAKTGELVDQFDLHGGRIRACQFTKDDTGIITIGEDGAAVWCDLQRHEVIQRIDLLPCKLFAMAQIDSRHLAVAGSDNRIRIVSLESGLIVYHLDGHRGSISNLVYSQGALFSGGYDSTLRRWAIEADTSERLAEKDSVAKPLSDSESR